MTKANPRGTPFQDHHSPSGFSPEHRPDSSNPLVSTFRWKQAPPGLATRRQLRERGLCPGGQEPVARIECRRGQRWAWLYRIDLAKPKRTPTLAQEAALDKAMSARQTCRSCRRRYLHCLQAARVTAPADHFRRGTVK
ncbi:RRQRL motif-containing zinc-binding protein [Streptomyces sp. NPDC057620]|uniref:RRQRL motif-containing zinc-binding protein n=1 Tax=Streptomyces sp. NPDC057620 TaxID=3346185 RepID=UPI0036B95894